MLFRYDILPSISRKTSRDSRIIQDKLCCIIDAPVPSSAIILPAPESSFSSMDEKTSKVILALVVRGLCKPPEMAGKIAANVVMNDVFAFLSEKGWSVPEVEEYRKDFVHNLSDLVYLRSADLITTKHVKELIPKIWDTVELDLISELRDSKILEEAGGAELLTIIDGLLANNQKIVDQIKGGKESAIGFFVGQVMKVIKGKGNPAEIKTLIHARISE